MRAARPCEMPGALAMAATSPVRSARSGSSSSDSARAVFAPTPGIDSRSMLLERRNKPEREKAPARLFPLSRATVAHAYGALDYHERTKHSPRSVRAANPGLDFENKPRPYKVYADRPAVPAAERIRPPQQPALSAIAEPTPDGDPRRDRRPI